MGNIMKHLRLLPLLIAAAAFAPRAHAAEQANSQHETSSYAAGLICLGLVALTGRSTRSQTFKR
jgi:hypothetical protein